MKRAVIMGGSSGIGLEVARLLLNDGWQLGVAARRSALLEALRQQYPEQVLTAAIDVNSNDAEARLHEFIERLGGMELYFHASGVGFQNPQLERERELAIVETNGLGFARMVGAAFRYFAEHGGGHLAAISSIAGTKGLGVAPAYSATKAFQQHYLQALEQQANSRGLAIRITDIRPGFVDTAFLSDTHHYPMLLKPQTVARSVVRALYSKRHVVTVDWRWCVVTALWRRIPRWLWRRLRLSV